MAASSDHAQRTRAIVRLHHDSGKGAGVEGQTELELLEDSISVAVIRLER